MIWIIDAIYLLWHELSSFFSVESYTKSLITYFLHIIQKSINLFPQNTYSNYLLISELNTSIVTYMGKMSRSKGKFTWNAPPILNDSPELKPYSLKQPTCDLYSTWGITFVCTKCYSPSLKMGTMRGFICARYTIAHLIQQINNQGELNPGEYE